MKIKQSAAIATVAALAAAGIAMGANHPPKWPRTFKVDTSTDYQYRDGLLYGGVTTIKIKSPAKDPDGHRLRYRWKAKNILSDGDTVRARVRGHGKSVDWTRWIDHGELAAGVVTVTVTDGHGGRLKRKLRFERDPG